MTRIHRTITLQEDVNKMLELENASTLINDLIINHFSESKDFKRIRIMSKLKLLKQQRKELEIEEKKLELEVKNFSSVEKQPIDELSEDVSVKTVNKKGSFEKDKLREQRG